MWTRRRFVALAGIAALVSLGARNAFSRARFPEAPARASHASLVAMARAVWTRRSAASRRVLRRTLDESKLDLGALLARKEREAADSLRRATARETYAELCALDFRAGRTVSVAGVVLCETDLAILWVSA